MADQRTRIGEEIVRICRNFYSKYEDDNPVKCAYGVKQCDYIIFAGLHKGFKSMNLFDAAAVLQENLGLEAMIQTAKSVVEAVRSNIQDLRISEYIHTSCYTTGSIFQSLESMESKLQLIKPLNLTSFSRNPASSHAESTWSTFLHEKGTLQTSNSTHQKPKRKKKSIKSANKMFSQAVCMYGDMEIVLRSCKISTIYSVSSHQLRAGSTIFRELLREESAFQKHSQNDTSQATLCQLEIRKDFDPKVFAIFLYILHGRGHNLPHDTMPFETAIILVAICDEYNCSALLQPWHGRWIHNWRQYSDSSGYEDRLLAAWVTGDDKIFQALTKTFAETGIVQDKVLIIIVEEEPGKDVQKLCKFIHQEIIGI